MSTTRTRSVAGSELAGATGILGGLRDLVDGAADGRDDGGGDSALHEWSVDQPGVTVALALEHVADREDRAAEVAEHDHAVATIRAADRVTDERIVGAKRALGPAARDLDPDFWPGDLACQLGDAARKLGAMRDHYDANQFDRLVSTCR
jgi:hypothetical protein